MKRTFKEYLELIKQYDIDMLDIEIAYLVDSRMETINYERMCKYVRNCYLEDKNGNITIDSIIDAILDLEENEEMNEEEIYNIREYKIIDKASYYI